MAKYNRNTGQRWSDADVHRLAELAAENTPTRVIGLKLGRTEAAVQNKASKEDISLRPTNEAPYSRRKR